MMILFFNNEVLANIFPHKHDPVLWIYQNIQQHPWEMQF